MSNYKELELLYDYTKNNNNNNYTSLPLDFVNRLVFASETVCMCLCKRGRESTLKIYKEEY